MGELSPASWLREGIAAAKAGRRDAARAALQQAAAADPENCAAWLWLSSVETTLPNQAACLERVLTLDPHHEAARKGLAVLNRRIVDEALPAAITAATAGDGARAQELLRDCVARVPETPLAWLWLARLTSEEAERRLCWENVLALDPHNAEARDGLDALTEGLSEADFNAVFNPWATPEPEEPAAAAPPTLPLEPEPESPSSAAALWARFENELLCPYCAAPTEYDQRRCPRCGRPLWMQVRRQQEWSLRLGLLWGLHGAALAYTLGLPPLALEWMAHRVGANFLQALPGYFFLPTPELSPEIFAAVLHLLPRGVFYLTLLPAMFSLFMFVGIYFRWPMMYYIVMGYAGLLALLTLGFAIKLGTVWLLLLLLIPLVLFLNVLPLEDYFLLDEVRWLLQPDRRAKDGVSAQLCAREYAGRGMWALAAIHFRRAAGGMVRNGDACLSLADACLRLGELELAAHALADARRVLPDHPQVATLAAAISAAQHEVQ